MSTQDKVSGFLLVGLNDKQEVVINLNYDRTGHVVFSANQARHLGRLLLKKSDEVDGEQSLSALELENASIAAERDGLREAIWPGLPKWVPTTEQPQQDFYLACAEALRGLLPLEAKVDDLQAELASLAAERDELTQDKDTLLRSIDNADRVIVSRSAELATLQAAIRKHRDFRGDDRCWEDDVELYKTLPEGYEAPASDTAVELSNCQRFIECRQNPSTEYVSPQREIERLQAERDELRKQVIPWKPGGEMPKFPPNTPIIGKCSLDSFCVPLIVRHDEEGQYLDSFDDFHCDVDWSDLSHWCPLSSVPMPE